MRGSGGLVMTTCAVRLGGHASPHPCPPPAYYAVESGTYNGAIRRTADHTHADGALYASPFAPMPTQATSGSMTTAAPEQQMCTCERATAFSSRSWRRGSYSA